MHQQINKYETLIIPIDYDKKFLDLNGEEIMDYYNWFLNIKTERMIHLCNFLFDNQKDCISEKNLKVIEIFLLNTVSTQPKPIEKYNEEVKKIPLHLKSIAKPTNYIFDTQTISICYDIGIFMGELIINLDSKIFWKLEVDDNFADYGQPVLAKKKSKFSINPFIVAKNAAAKIYDGTYKDEQLISFFNTWKKVFRVDG